jgi:nucleoid DNA-binding protein
MHKIDLIKKVAQGIGIKNKDAKKAVNAVLSEITAALKEGQSVTLTGFGTFVIRTKKERAMKNIHTGEPIQVPAHNVVGFHVGDPLRTMVR